MIFDSVYSIILLGKLVEDKGKKFNGEIFYYHSYNCYDNSDTTLLIQIAFIKWTEKLFGIKDEKDKDREEKLMQYKKELVFWKWVLKEMR